MTHANILIRGVVQGVGFRYFVYRLAKRYNLLGYVKNMPNGEEVFCEVEGEKWAIDEFYAEVKIGPSYSHVVYSEVKYSEATNAFSEFQIKGW